MRAQVSEIMHSKIIINKSIPILELSVIVVKERSFIIVLEKINIKVELQ